MFWAFLSVAAVGLFWLGYRHPRRRRWLLLRPGMKSLSTSNVDRQHKHLLAGGRFGEAAVAAFAARFRELLRSGHAAELEREIHPGTDFALQVQALARIGTTEAGSVLERQLTRRLSHDPVEQTWYWADAASGLRQLHHTHALPALLRCVDKAADSPPGTVLAAEVVAFPDFASALKDLSSPLARPALRAITRVVKGCRDGAIDPGSLLAIGVGEMLARLSDSCPTIPDPWLTQAILEAERLYRRIGPWKQFLDPEVQSLAERQGLRLWETASQRSEWLQAAPKRLMERFSIAPTHEQTAILHCLFEFNSDILSLFPHLPDRRAVWWMDAMRCLTWTKSSVVGPVLARQTLELMSTRRNHHRAAVLLATLGGLPCHESEEVLLRAAASVDPNLRLWAASALGWWEPFNTAAVLNVLQTLRTEPVHNEIRQAAVAALARLGVRSALEEIREELLGEETAIRAATARRIAQEGLSWLWPDLQEVAESDDPEAALAAIEAIERLRENAVGVFRA
jgi:hypothetical protein